MNRSEGSLIGGRSNAPLEEARVKSVTATFVGLDPEVPFQLDPAGRTRFVVEDEEDGPIGKVYFGPDVYPGPGVADPNSALSMKAAVAHEISHFHRWRDATELPLGEHTHLDEALTSLDAALRFSKNLSGHEMEQLVRDAVHRLQLFRAELLAAVTAE